MLTTPNVGYTCNRTGGFISSVFHNDALKVMCISVYMRINTHSPLYIFYLGKFFFIYLFIYRFFQQQRKNITML
jgi:hypothetical protein